MSIWHHGHDIAWVQGHTRLCIMNLERLDQPPAVLEGAAIMIFDAVDGTRNTEEVVAHLREIYPHELQLPEHVRTGLTQLEAAGLVYQDSPDDATKSAH